MSSYHIPVLLKETTAALSLLPGKIIVDGTLGGGGHSLEILESCSGIILYGFDQDIDAIKKASEALSGEMQKIGEAMMKNQKAEEPKADQSAPAQEGAEKKDDNVKDAEYKETGGEEKK